ncbi:uncharacterized protein F5147DRAFT_660588 [Suillus discolor]|uniref:Uncharacterized protein n=1 Tax=Suillus discolor TaxID=1912936 RepID=A0A9P7ERC6_9AGAM|nr:uncharacterized protein F5147DRAFT_660588 [Suillus discolor]KAG2082069.1 hypothetical protein F5147DRAFT_660588 [Suillus discolor]
MTKNRKRVQENATEGAMEDAMDESNIWRYPEGLRGRALEALEAVLEAREGIQEHVLLLDGGRKIFGAAAEEQLLVNAPGGLLKAWNLCPCMIPMSPHASSIENLTDIIPDTSITLHFSDILEKVVMEATALHEDVEAPPIAWISQEPEAETTNPMLGKLKWSMEN